MQIVASVTRRQSRNGLSARTGVGSYSARKALLTAAVAVAASLPGARALAQDLSWDTNGAANSDWTTTDGNWVLNGNGGTLWNNSANYGAVFGVDNFGLAVQLPGGITARSVDVQAGNVSFNGTGPLTLVGAGTGAYIGASFTVGSLITTTMNVPIYTTASRVLTKQGLGTLVLGATNSLVGTTVLNTLRNDAQTYRANLLIGVPITDSSVIGGTVRLSAGTSLSSTDSIGFGSGFLDLNGQTVTVANIRSGNTGQSTAAWANATNAGQGVIGAGTIKVLGEITSQVSFNFSPGIFGITSNIDLGAKNQVFRTAFAGGSSIGSSNMVVSGVMSNGGVLLTSGMRGASLTSAEGVTFIANNTYTGPTIINGGGNVFTGSNLSETIRVEGGQTSIGGNITGGNLVLQTATGAFPNATSVLIAGNASVLLDNATLNGNTAATLPFLSRGSNLNRIGDTAAVELRDGRLTFVGPVSATGFETIGSLNISGGLGTIQITPSNTGAGNTAGIQVTGNLTLGANAALKVQTSTTGTGNSTNAVGGNARLLIAGTVPAAVGGILPRIVTASDFTTYNAVTGITPLSSYSSTLTAGSNFTVASTGTLVASSVNVNSVKGAAAISLQPGVTLGVTSGMFMGLGTTTVQGFGTMSFGGTTGAIFGSTVNLNAPVSGTAGLLVSDASLNLNGNMSGLSGTITQNNGTLTINTPTVAAGIALRTGTLNLNVSEPGSGRGAAVIGVAANDADLAYSAPNISFSAAGPNAVFGRDFVINNGGRTVAGHYSISGVGLSPLPNAQGSQTFTGNWTINSPVSLTGSGTSGSSAYNGVTRFTGNITGSSLFAIGANGRVAFDGTYSQTGGFEINAGGGNSAAMYFSGASVGSQPINITGNGAFAFASVTVGYTSDIALPSGPLTLLASTAYIIPTGNSTRSQAITSYGDLFFAPPAGTTTTLTGTVLTPAVNDGFSSAYTVGLAGLGRLILPADPAINVKVAVGTYFADNAAPLVYNHVTVTGTGTLDLSGYVGNVTRTAGQVIAIENGTVTGGTIDGAGTISFVASGTATATSFPTVASNLAGNTTVVATGTGTPPVLGASMALTLTGTNTYAGPTNVSFATLRGVDGVNISPNSTVTLTGAVLEGSSSYQRTPGTDLVLVGLSGFSARGGPATVSLGGPSAPQIVFGSAGLTAATGLVLNGPAANDNITLKNPVDLGGATRTFAVYTGSAIAEGVISNGALLKSEVSPRNASGTLVLAATNTYSGDTTVQGLGFLRAVDGVGLPTASKLVLQMGGSIQTSGTFARNYDGAGGVVMPFVVFPGFTNATAAGFDNLSDTPGSPLTVSIGGVGSPTTLKLDPFVGGAFGATTLLFNTSTVANGPVTVANPIDVYGFNASVTYPVGGSIATMLGMQFQVGNGNGAAGVGTVNMTGGIIDNFGNGAFTKTGPGLLVLGATPATWGVINNQGTIAVTGGTLATAPGVGLLAGRVAINGGTFDPTSGGLTNTYTTLDRQIIGVTLNASGSNIVGAVAGTGTLSYGGGTAAITQSVPNDLGGALNVTVSSTGVTSFSGTNTHSGITHVSGVARFASASAISPNSNLRLANFGTLQTSGNFAPVLGTGAGQFSFNTGASTAGFDAWSTTPGTALTLNFGGAGATLTAGGTFLPRTLNLNTHASNSANGPITFVNGLDLNAGNFTFNVGTGSATGNAGTVTLSGAITGAAASTGTVTKSGNGRLVLTNAGNNWGTATTGLVVVSAGTLAVGPTAGLPKNINLTGGSFDASARVTPFPLASTQTISVQNAASQILGPIGGTGTISFGGTAANLQLTSSANIAGSVAVAVTNTGTSGFVTTTLTGAISTAAPITVSGNLNRLVLQSAPTGTNALNLSGSQVSVELAAPGSPSVNTVVGTFSSVNFTNGNNAGFSTTNILRITPTDRTTLKASVLITSAVNNATFTGSFLNGFLDIGNNDMIVKGGVASLTGLRSQVSAWLASRPTGSNWGIGSSLASPTSAPFTTVAMASNATVFGFAANSTFDGQAVDATDVLVKYTYVGDTDLNGLLDARDYNAVLNGWTNGLTGWQNGDVNYDGIVDVNDWSLFANAYAWFTSQMSPPTYGDPTGNGSAVPEPAALALLAPVAALLGRRRRR